MTAPLRSLPRCFVPGASLDEPITLPEEDYQKFHRVLRLAPGDEILVLPNDGSGIRARYQGKTALPEERVLPNTEAAARITIIQALPKGDKLDEIVRSCSEIGAAGFVFFPADRTIVKWDEAKVMARMKRLETISKEACEISFRTNLPEFEYCPSLEEALAGARCPVILDESESASIPLRNLKGKDCDLLVGPEGGWSPQEFKVLKGKRVTMGPRVLRVDHAAAAALAVLLID